MKIKFLTEKTRFKIIFTISLIILLPFFISGILCSILGKFISAFRYVFWLEPKNFAKELKEIFKNIGYK